MAAAIIEIAPARDRALRLRAHLLEAVDAVVEAHDLALGGFALIAWDTRGSPVTAVAEEGSSLSPRLDPDLCA